MGAEMALVPNGGAGLDTHTTWGTTESIQTTKEPPTCRI